MLAGLEMPPAVEVGQVITAVLADLRSCDRRGVVVESPLGAGKSTPIVGAPIEQAEAGEQGVLDAR